MEFEISRFAVCTIKRRKPIASQNTNLYSNEKTGNPEESGCKSLDSLERDGIMNQDMKKADSNASFKRFGPLLKSKLNAHNLKNAINTWAVAVVWYSDGFIDWKRKEFEKMDKKSKHLFVQKAFHHPKANTIRLHMSQGDGRGSLNGTEECLAN